MDTSLNRKCKRCLLRDLSQKDYEENILKYIEAIKEEDRADDTIRTHRLDVCRECDRLSQGTCLSCGCYVEIRSSLKDGRCPKKKW